MRLIDADALKEEINKKKVVGRFNTLLLIDSAETVEQPTGEWIPVKERLPTKTGLYLVSIDDLVTTLSYAGIGFVNRGGVRVDVDAWMTLPNPYRKGGEGE